ncbi:MAG: DNA repair protein RecN, partial [Steroidobacteraceae bacterium]
SRCFVNGQALPAQAVRELGSLLVDIHGQQEFLSLMQRDAQRDLLDRHGRLEGQLADVAGAAAACRTLKAELERLGTAALEREARLELLRYQVGELQALGLDPDEIAGLTVERDRLAHRGRLAEAGAAALGLCYEAEDANAHALASRAATALRQAAQLDPELTAPLQLLDEALIALKEAGVSLAGYLEGLEVDPNRQDWVERRMAAIEELSRKHRVDAAELPRRLDELSRELDELEHSGIRLAGLSKELEAATSRYRQLAVKLGKGRQAAAKKLSASVTASMATLGMPGGKLSIEVKSDPQAEPSATGDDEVTFLVTANPGQPLKPVAKVASGGELSRISLAVQVAAAHGGASTCMVFDEVDAGVGGAVAERVGRQLAELGERGQVLCVTHLAQVASQATRQVRISKLTDGKSSRVTVSTLGEEERVEELARMLGGVEITRRAREHAREMLRAAAELRRA